MRGHDFTPEVKDFTLGQGADLVGIADMGALRGITTIPDGLVDRFPRAVSLALRLSDAAVDSITDRPTRRYVRQYRQANKRLDAVSVRVCEHLIAHGYHAMPVPASCVIDWDSYRGNVPHQAVARQAGLGWQGKSLLIVNPSFGPRLRLSTVLTDMPLKPDSPLPNRCGECHICADACPAGAIKGVATKDHYLGAYDAMDLRKCHTQLKAFRGELKVD
ncbi:MAG: 4Fe-4S binding protein, partial [Chloroflexota bacterium]